MTDEPKKLRPSDIADEFSPSVTTQSYAKKTPIAGLKIVDLRAMTDDGGSFAEIGRINSSGELELFASEGFKPRQISFSIVSSGAIKAFHLHYNQDDIWFVPPSDRMLLGLVDVRADSPTKGAQMRIVLGAGQYKQVFIPRGVAHGVVNLAQTPGTIFYFVNQQFNLDDPDERRLPWDMVGADFWEMTPG
jgi:dTDP-4-dehydrorhamnose 3,5-epimerase-like enzyme